MNSSFLAAPARGVFADRQARCVFLFSMLGRSTYGIFPLALILSAQQATGSLSLGSVAASLVYGRYAPGIGRLSQLIGLSALLAVGLVTAATALSAWLFALGLIVAGCAIAPTMVIAYNLADRLVATERAAEAGAWINVAFNLGVAGGSAAGGWAVSGVGTSPTLYAAACVALVVATSLSVVSWRRASRAAAARS